MLKSNLAIIFTVFLLVSCTTVKESSEIKIGVIGPLTGPVAKFGEYMREGIELAVNEVNDAGGVNGKKISLIYEDTKCIDLKATISALQKFKEIDKVAGVLGPYCGTTNIIAGQFSTDNKLFILAPGDNFGRTGDYKVNTRYHIKKEAELLAEYALSKGWKRVAIVYYDNDWGQAYRDHIKNYLSKNGGELVIAEAYTFDNLDIRTQLLKVKEAKPDALMITDGLQGELFQQVREVGLNMHLLSEWEIEKPEHPKKVRDALEGVVYFLPIVEETGFHSKFRTKYQQEPNVAHVDSYDAAILMAKALENCPDYNPECMVNYVASLKDYPGAGGQLTFNKDAWSFDKKFVRKTVKNGEFVVAN